MPNLGNKSSTDLKDASETDEKMYDSIADAIAIRATEELFLDLFSKGELTGTVHTCIGQEFSALAFAGQLGDNDVIFSNHRCHGHYLAFTSDFDGLVAELLGKETGTCGGIGSSQHLWKPGFYSNGIQGGIVPLAAGYALAHKLNQTSSIAVVFIGDGTLGEGVVYETLNIASKWGLPILFVCEDNDYAQSTPKQHTLAGDVVARAQAFGIEGVELSTDYPDELMRSACEIITEVRDSRLPKFVHVKTSRLASHSKGDDTRSDEEIAELREKDCLNRFSKEKPDLYEEYQKRASAKLGEALEKAKSAKSLPFEQFRSAPADPKENVSDWIKWEEADCVGQRLSAALNASFQELLGNDPSAILIGEDILSPYGGAFKVAAGLSEKYPDQVLSTPISEAAIVGMASGLALAGKSPFAEIMFGDFVTLAADQIINHAAKFYGMYNQQVNCPIVVRTPMGGGRGYGPTHSQSLEKLFIGIAGLKVVAINPYLDPEPIIEALAEESGPVLLIEHKLDYSRIVGLPAVPFYEFHRTKSPYPTLRARPTGRKPDFTIVTYGGMTTMVFDTVVEIFENFEVLPEVLVLTSLSPIDYLSIVKSVKNTQCILTVEEGTLQGGVASEILAHLSEKDDLQFKSMRLASMEAVIPAASHLENEVIPGKDRILNACKKLFS